MKIVNKILLPTLIIVCSCNKPGNLSDYKNGIIHGRVTDKTNGSPVANALVYLQGYEGGGSILSSGPTFTVATTNSDADGDFSFDFDYNDENGYFCSAIADQYFDYNEEFVINSNITGSGINTEVTLYPKAWLNVHVKAINGYQFSDFISIQNVYDDPFYGDSIDEYVDLTVNGNMNYHLVWFIYSGGLNDGSESAEIYCPAFDTSYYELLY